MFDTTLWCKAEQIARTCTILVDGDHNADGEVVHIATSPHSEVIAIQATAEEAVAACREMLKAAIYRQLADEQAEGRHPLGWEGD